jgi:PKD repeat protein
MNRIVKWIMITSICTIFALDCIVLLSVKAGAAAVYQKPVANFTSNVTSDCTRLDFQFIDQSTNCSTSWSRDSGDSGTTSMRIRSIDASSGTYTTNLID